MIQQEAPNARMIDQLSVQAVFSLCRIFQIDVEREKEINMLTLLIHRTPSERKAFHGSLSVVGATVSTD